MSDKERERLKILEQMAAGVLSTERGGERLGVTQRQAQRLLAAYRRHGAAVARHGLRERRPNNAKPPDLQARALQLVRAHYSDFGPTLAAEELAERHGLPVNHETLRQWLIANGQWRGARKGRRHRLRRPRRRCFGELVQIDTSEHDWLEGRGERLSLVALIDDATGRKLGRFFRSDTTEANMEMIAAWIATFGRPVALYTDWASHFRQPQQAGEKVPQTQIERALAELDIRLICAHSPQAKGRVERSHGTDQDRLVKGLRLEGVCTLEAANRYLEQVYLPRINARLAKAPADPADAHRPAAGWDLAAILCAHEHRTVANDWTVSIDGVAWQIERAERTGRLRGQRVNVERRRDGTLRLRWGDRYLKFRRAAGQLERAPGWNEPLAPAARAVDLPPCGQPGPGGQDAGSNNRLSTRLEQPGGSPAARPPVVHKLHSPDDDAPLSTDPVLRELKKPVQIPNCTRKPKPDHPWR